MRLSSPNLPDEVKNEIALFIKWTLDIGEGKIEASTKNGESEPSWIIIPSDFLLMPEGNNLFILVQSTYPNNSENYNDSKYLKARAILTPTNDMVDSINEYIVSIIPGDTKEYRSCDTIIKGPNTNDEYDLLYPVEFLNSLHGNNFPQHLLVLKKGVPIMLLRNLNQSEGLCNGTRLIITLLGDLVLEAKIITGIHSGKIVLIPRICLPLKNYKLPFVLERRQFPVKVCYAMTINKSQGQTLTNVGIYLRRPVFTHGQLYVAISRVTSKQGLKILIEDDDGKPSNETKNIVYKEIFSRFSSTTL
jgi:ATP-dependent DNA helicase PIF1